MDFGVQEQKRLLIQQQKRLLKLQLDMIQVWTVYLFDNQHRSIVNYICKQTEQQKMMTYKSLQIFKNSKNILTQLRDGFVLQQIQNKTQKTYNIRINPNFFVMIPKLIEVIKLKINPQFQKMKNFKINQNKKICKNCNYQTTQEQINFMGVNCNCAQPKFISVKFQRQKKQRYQQLQRLFSYIISKLKQYEQIQNSIARLQRQRDKRSQKKRSQYQILLDRYGIKVQSYQKNTNYEYLQQSFKAFSPKRQFEMAKEINQIIKQRNQSQ